MKPISLFAVLNAIYPLSEKIKFHLNAIVKEETFSRKTLLLSEGDVAKKIYFIVEGITRGYYVKNGEEYTTWFMQPGDVMISVYSFFTQKPSQEYIELLDDSTLQSITWQQLQQLYTDFPEFNIIGRMLTEQYYIESEERAIALRCLSAAGRYELFSKRFPQIIQKASVGQIATHLGISRETLSRIRAKR